MKILENDVVIVKIFSKIPLKYWKKYPKKTMKMAQMS